MKQIEGQMTLEGCKEVKPLIYSLSLTCHKTICPYCKMDNPDSVDMKDCTKRYHVYREQKEFYPYFDLPLNFCPRCGKEFDRDNCEVRVSREYAKADPEYMAKLWKDEKGKYRERKPE
jgi:hypothetical protein